MNDAEQKINKVLSCSHFSETSHTTVKAALTSLFEYVCNPCLCNFSFIRVNNFSE